MRGLVQWLGYPVAKVQFLPEKRPLSARRNTTCRAWWPWRATPCFLLLAALPRIATYLGLFALYPGLDPFRVVDCAFDSRLRKSRSPGVILIIMTHILGARSFVVWASSASMWAAFSSKSRTAPSIFSRISPGTRRSGAGEWRVARKKRLEGGARGEGREKTKGESLRQQII